MSVLKSLSYLVQCFVLQRQFLMARERRFSLKFKCSTRDTIGRHIYKYGAHEGKLTTYLLQSISFNPNDIMLDIGAHIGWYTNLFAKAFSNQINIHAFEPKPDNYQLLEHNISLNKLDNITLVPKAVSNTTQHVTLHLHKNSNRDQPLTPIHDSPPTEVDTLILNDYFTEQQLDMRKVKFIKINVQGYEYPALAGASNILTYVPTVLTEYSPLLMHQCGQSPYLLLDLMTEHGFKPYRWANHLFEPIAVDVLRRWTANGENILWRK
ncbi:MAG: FkbM family methyltransferase [Legionellales bacterium]|nr:FkbM family methyltransferase [Legionellales bacterium]